jgi:hypothetical protein
MVNLDWKRLLSLSPEDLTDDEKDELYGSLILYNPETNIDADLLKVLFHFTQDILKYKGEQVCRSITPEHFSCFGAVIFSLSVAT